MFEVVRICFKKQGAAAFCSHLDLTRTVQRLLRKSGVPMWYTEGFHPHPYIVFAAPLPLGVEGMSELVEFRCTQPFTDTMKENIMASFPQTLQVVDCYVPERKFTEIDAARFTIVLQTTEGVEPFLQQPLPIVKRSKRSEKEIDVLDYIVDWTILEKENETVKMSVSLKCNSEKNLNPTYLVQALQAKIPALSPIHIVREHFLDAGRNLFR